MTLTGVCFFRRSEIIYSFQPIRWPTISGRCRYPYKRFPSDLPKLSMMLSSSSDSIFFCLRDLVFVNHSFHLLLFSISDAWTFFPPAALKFYFSDKLPLFGFFRCNIVSFLFFFLLPIQKLLLIFRLKNTKGYLKSSEEYFTDFFVGSFYRNARFLTLLSCINMVQHFFCGNSGDKYGIHFGATVQLLVNFVHLQI